MTTEPPTTPPTTDTNSTDTLDAADLLDEDGNIDVSAVKEITNAGNMNNSPVTPGECCMFRHTVRRGVRPCEIDTEYNQATVRRHVRGACNHEHGEPTAEYDEDADEWRAVE